MAVPTSDPRTPAERDRVTVRRALLAGGLTWVAVGVTLGFVMGTGGGRAAAVGVLLALVLGAVVASLWLLAAAAIDVWTEQPIGRGRLLWTAATVLVALLSPMMVLGVGG